MNGSIVGIDVGGTFTDLIMVGEDGHASVHKVLNGRFGAMAAIDGIRHLVPDIAQVRSVVQGTTIATNTVIERTGATTILAVTRGFRDVLELQRQDRSDVWDLLYQKPVPLVPRELRVEVDERLAADGSVVTAIDADAEAARLLAVVDSSGAEAIAICFLHAYRNPVHEQALAQRLRALRPELHISASHEVAPQYREYDRMSTTVLNAYLGPVVHRHTSTLTSTLADLGFKGEVLVMQSSGGVVPASSAQRLAASLCLSGPAGGVLAATQVAAAAGVTDLICLDMGGTSTDVALVRGGRPDVTYDAMIDGLPNVLPTLRIETVGAGGGSIIQVDEAGRLLSGPRSAGANPGPACYGNGGAELTVTDAWCVLGVLRENAHGSYLSLKPAEAYRAAKVVADAMGLSVHEACWQALQVTTANMSRALRLVSVEQGHDPRDFTIVCYGGAGGLHAAMCADELGVQRVLVPVAPGVFSAYGMVCADISRSYLRTHLVALLNAAELIANAIDEMSAEAEKEFRQFGRDEPPLLRASLDLRYAGQAYELSIDVSDADPAALVDRFHEAHERRFGFSEPDTVVELVNVRLDARAPLPTPQLGSGVAVAEVESCSARTALDDTMDTKFVARAALAVGARINGPAVIEEPTSTTVVPTGWSATRDEKGNLWLRKD